MAWRHGVSARHLEKELTLPAVWRALFSTATWGGKVHTPAGSRLEAHLEAFLARPLVCHPTASGWHCTLEGGEPELVVIFHRHEAIITWDGHRARQLPPLKPRTELLWRFHDQYLAGATGPVTIEPPGGHLGGPARE